MNTITIPRRMMARDDLVIVSRKEYEDLLRRCLRKTSEVELTPLQKRKLVQARKNMARGNYLTIDELERKLGFAR